MSCQVIIFNLEVLASAHRYSDTAQKRLIREFSDLQQFSDFHRLTTKAV